MDYALQLVPATTSFPPTPPSSMKLSIPSRVWELRHPGTSHLWLFFNLAT